MDFQGFERGVGPDAAVLGAITTLGRCKGWHSVCLHLGFHVSRPTAAMSATTHLYGLLMSLSLATQRGTSEFCDAQV